MKPSRVAEVLQRLLATRWPAFLWGPPGVGKSSVVRAVADALGSPVIDVRAALLDPTDLRGIPAVVEGRAVWAPPGFLPTDDDPPGILFFDELSAAPPLVQASLYQLTLDRRVGEYRLPEGWRIVAAGNRVTDASVSFRMPAALSNRFVHLDFEVDFEDWRRWAVDRRIHPMVISFLGLRRELLFQPPGSALAFATPRSWEMASDVLTDLGTGDEVQDVLLGVVGEGPALEFMSFVEQALREEDIVRILDAPESAALPSDLGGIYALVTHIAYRAKEPTIQRSAGKLLPRLDPEFGVLLVRDMLRLAPAFAANPDCAAFVQSHGDLIL